MANASIRLDGVAKFYGEVLGVNRITLAIEPGITGLVGPSGSGKSTLMNLIAGLNRPSRGIVSVLGRSATNPSLFYRDIGYCAQYDAFPSGMTGAGFVTRCLRLQGHGPPRAAEAATHALGRAGLSDMAERPIDVYSKGMRQALKLAAAMCHGPKVLILDEPLNGLDPQARAEASELFREVAANGATVLVSSHILHEVEALCGRVVFLDGGYLAAAGDVAEMQDHLAVDALKSNSRPARVSIRCDRAEALASGLFARGVVADAQLEEDGGGLAVGPLDADAFYAAFGDLVCESGIEVESVQPTEGAVAAFYEQLVARRGS